MCGFYLSMAVCVVVWVPPLSHWSLSVCTFLPPLWASKIIAHLLTWYMKSEFSEENLNFWRAVQDLKSQAKQGADAQMLLDTARCIVDKYVLKKKSHKSLKLSLSLSLSSVSLRSSLPLFLVAHLYFFISCSCLPSLSLPVSKTLPIEYLFACP